MRDGRRDRPTGRGNHDDVHIARSDADDLITLLRARLTHLYFARVRAIGRSSALTWRSAWVSATGWSGFAITAGGAAFLGPTTTRVGSGSRASVVMQLRSPSGVIELQYMSASVRSVLSNTDPSSSAPTRLARWSFARARRAPRRSANSNELSGATRSSMF